MSYIDKYLLSGETVAFRTRPHWIAGAKSFFVMLVLLVMAGLGIVLYGRTLDDLDAAQRLYLEAGAAGLVLLLIAIVLPILGNRTVECVVTNQRIIIKTGFWSHKTTEMFLSRVESLSVEQSFMGRILNYGSVTIHGSGGTPEPFHRIAKAREFQRQIQEQIRNAQVR
ncbi:MAG TPA: PH domain-containing protein [Candidatus Angelobacter sp.]|nr:PH domain-containing protein [Candidatus Angelobacter sp.]